MGDARVVTNCIRLLYPRRTPTLKSGLVPMASSRMGTNTSAHASDDFTVIGRYRTDRSFCRPSRRLVDYASRIGELRTPDEVLEALHAIITKSLPLCVLGAVQFPVNAAGWNEIRLGKSVFLHKDVPDGWWEEHVALSEGRFSPILFLARSSLASFTWTEVQRQFEPVGIDRWSHELALKYRMRDGLTCPVGGRWAVAFWSRKHFPTS